MTKKSAVEIYLQVQECLADLLEGSERSLSMLYVRLNQLCSGCEQLFRWADDAAGVKLERRTLLTILADKAEVCKSKGAVNNDFQKFLETKILRELNELRPDLLAANPLAS